jgi:hypothetical protein
MTTLAIILLAWSVIGAVLSIPGMAMLWIDSEISGFSLKFVLIIFILGPFVWLSILGIIIAALINKLLS